LTVIWLFRPSGNTRGYAIICADTQDCEYLPTLSSPVRPLAAGCAAWRCDGSPMSRKAHARFYEGLGVRPGATHRNIYVDSERAGHRAMQSVTSFITHRLKLKVNQAKRRGSTGARKFGMRAGGG
jgi:hypothetical protein